MLDPPCMPIKPRAGVGHLRLRQSETSSVWKNLAAYHSGPGSPSTPECTTPTKTPGMGRVLQQIMYLHCLANKPSGVKRSRSWGERAKCSRQVATLPSLPATPRPPSFTTAARHEDGGQGNAPLSLLALPLAKFTRFCQWSSRIGEEVDAFGVSAGDGRGALRKPSITLRFAADGYCLFQRRPRRERARDTSIMVLGRRWRRTPQLSYLTRTRPGGAAGL